MESSIKTTQNQGFKPSPYQAAIYDFIQKGKGNAVISAVAGSGKTTTIVNALKLIDTEKLKTIFIAFNKSIVEELSKKVPQSVLVSTIHSLGWKAILYQYKTFKPQLNNRKYDDLLKVLSQTWDIQIDDETELAEYTGRVRKLIDIARVSMVNLDNVAELEELADKFDVQVLNGECANALNTIKVGNKSNTEFDFTDMIYIPAFKNFRMFKYDWVFVDECQDLNKAQQAILKSICGGRFVAVGDRQQAIYGFSGADSESFNNLLAIPNTIELPLSCCYRCGKNIIQLAQSIVPHLSYPETAIDGVINEDGKNADILDGDYVLCRNTAPLVSLCLQFLAKGTKAMILGGDIGKNLINMVKKTRKKTTDEMFAILEKDLMVVKAKLIKKKKLTDSEVNDERAVIMFNEKLSVLEIVTNQKHLKTTDALINNIEGIFSDEKQGIVFSTIHKSKGLEADRVHIICRELMPNKKAKKDWEKQQEQNLIYVAYTRAKKQLIFNTEFVFDQNN